MHITLDLPDAVISLLGPAPERVIYKLIKAHLAPPKVGRPIANTNRDADIVNEASAGTTHASIANKYGLSIVRISQIIARSAVERPAKNVVRDQVIADRAVAGITYATIANEYGLSMARVSQIVAQGKTAAYARHAAKTNETIRAMFKSPAQP